MGFDMRYNKKEAIELEKKQIKNEMKNVDYWMQQVDSSLLSADSVHQFIQRVLEDKIQNAALKEADWQDKLISPTPYSLSGIGVLYFHKTKGMGIAMWVSMILSVLTFLFWRFLKRWLVTILFIGANFITLLVFMISCLSNDVSLEYGFWLLFFLMLMQIWIELLELKYSIIGRLLSNLNK